MQPKKLRVPAVIHHKATDQDCLFLRGADGVRRMVYLGKHDSAEAARRYREVLADHFAGRPVAMSAQKRPKGSEWPTIAKLCFAFLLHADRYYTAGDGKKSRAVAGFELALNPLLHLYRDLTTDAFTVTLFANVRQAMVDTGKLCRVTINARLGRIKHVFRWGTEQRLVPGSTWHELSAMRSLPIGRSGVRESKVVEAVPWAMVEKVRPHLPTVLDAALMLQWHSGMRPAEVLEMRGCDIDRGGPVWIYRPQQHKGTWRGKDRLVMLGPDAQAILRPLLKADANAYILSPRDSLAEQSAERRAHRQTPPTKQTRDRDAARETKEQPVGERYDVAAYRRAIHRACDDVNAAQVRESIARCLGRDPSPELLAQIDSIPTCDLISASTGEPRVDRSAVEQALCTLPDDTIAGLVDRAVKAAASVPLLERWSPHRLRHAAGTRLVLQKGLEAAKAVLGHSDIKVTQRYAVGAESVLAIATMQEHG